MNTISQINYKVLMSKQNIQVVPFEVDINVKLTVKPVLSGHSKRRPKIGFQDRLSLNAG